MWHFSFIASYDSMTIKGIANDSDSLNLLLIGAGPDGVEEIKRHRFFASIDWNVSMIY